MKNKKDYVARISQATPIDLSIISSEICIDYIDECIKMIEDKNINKILYHENLNKSKEIILEKIQACDRNVKLGKDLSSIFFTINQLIVDGQFAYNKEKFLQARKLLVGQMEIFKIAKKDENPAQKVVNASEKIIAGLTYGKGGLEEFVDSSSSRTFNA